MKKSPVLVLHTDEWDRLKKRANPIEQMVKNIQQTEYIKELAKQSQQKIQSWLDTIQGHVIRAKEKKNKKPAEEIAILKTFSDTNELKQFSGDAIKRAREMIFEESSYGKRLLSALIESKTIEERDIQVQVQREIKQKAADLERDLVIKSMEKPYIDLDKNKEKEIRKKQANLEIAQYNRITHEKYKQKLLKDKEEQQQLKVDNALMEKLLDVETKIEERYKLEEKQAIKEYENAQKEHKDRRIKMEQLHELLAEVWRKRQEKTREKMQLVLKQVPKQNTVVYEMINKSLEEKDKKYNEFIEKGVQKYEIRKSEKEALREKKRKGEREIHNLCSNGQIDARIDESGIRKSACDIQSLFTKSCYIRKNKTFNTPKGVKHTSFLSPSNKLSQELTNREGSRSWSGTSGAHAQFAKRATETLRQCKYKSLARKVVDDYRRLNCLDAIALPIPDY